MRYHPLVQFPFGRFDLTRLGHQLGFHLDISDNPFPSIWHPVATIRGVQSGVAIALQRFPRKGGTIDRAHAALWPPLDLGLRIKREGSVGRSVRSFFGSQDVSTGDATFDKPMRIQADEPDRARRLFRTAVRRTVLLASADTASFEVSDQGVRVEVWRAPRAWRDRIAAITQATAHLSAAARSLSSATALQPWAHALAPIAVEYGLRMSTCPLGAAGELAGLHLTVHFRRASAERWILELGTTISAVDPLGMVVALREGALKVDTFVLCKPRTRARDVSTGDKAFDDRFRVRAVAGGTREVRFMLGSRMRSLMLALSARFDVTYEHGMLRLRTELGRVAPAQLRGWVDEAANGIRSLGAHSPAYRS